MLGTGYILFSMVARDTTDLTAGVIDGGVFPTGGRVRWRTELRVSAITGTLTIELQVSPTGLDSTWTKVHGESVTAAGTTEFDGTLEVSVDPVAFTDAQVAPRDLYLRAQVTAITTATFDYVARAPWLDPDYQPDAERLTEELLSWDDRDRAIQEAEFDVMLLLSRKPRVPFTTDSHAPSILTIDPIAVEQSAGAPRALELDVDVTLPGALEAIQYEIAAQAEHLFQRDRLSRSKDSEDQITWRKMARLAPNIGERVRHLRSREAALFMGR